MTFKKNFELVDKVCVVTGGAGLLGKEFIRAIVENNGIAIIADNNFKLALKAHKSLSHELNTRNIDVFKVDITSKKDLTRCIKYLHKKYGKIDAIINNAYPKNKNYGKHFFNVKHNDFIENLSMNLGGYFTTSQQFSIYFKKQGYGNIINISSMYGEIAPKFEIYKGTKMTTPVEYAAIKSGLNHLTKYMAKYFKGLNIRVNALSPGGILDNQPKKFILKYNHKSLNKGMLNEYDLRGTLIYLLSDMSRYLNGQIITVDDGFSL
jgi:NAD(P)-dependent dehydrogenase (short-subunit alcohol dehydrogenase family)